jgi:lipocalin
VLTPRLSGLWLALVTPAQARVGRALVEGLRNSTVVRSVAARETFRIEPMPLRDAFVNAIDDGASARWKEDSRTIVVDAPPTRAFAPVRRIGGATGWYFGDLLWRARGSLDRRLGGVGMGRGRRDPDACAVGDVIDGWTVETFERDRRLRLSADLKLPGHGWLEFEITPLDDGMRSMIRQTATFDPRGLLGRVYWYALLPVHHLLFRGMLRQIAWAASVQPLRADPVYTVDNVNLDRYLGDWFEIARFPNRFQRACAGDVRASYARRTDGRIAVINRCRTADGRVTEARGVARVVDPRTFAKLKVRFAPAMLSFLPVVWGDYWILALASDYSWAVVGSPNREYLWILARTPTLDAERFASAAAAARANGFDVERLKKTNHSNPEGM